MIDRVVKSSDGVLLSYTINGTGKELIFFVHCWAGDQSYWRKQVDFFKRDFKVVTIDLAGHGKSGSGRGKWAMSSFRDDIIAVLNEMDHDNVYLVGHSMGEWQPWLLLPSWMSSPSFLW